MSQDFNGMDVTEFCRHARRLGLRPSALLQEPALSIIQDLSRIQTEGGAKP